MHPCHFATLVVFATHTLASAAQPPGTPQAYGSCLLECSLSFVHLCCLRNQWHALLPTAPDRPRASMKQATHASMRLIFLRSPAKIQSHVPSSPAYALSSSMEGAITSHRLHSAEHPSSTAPDGLLRAHQSLRRDPEPPCLQQQLPDTSIPHSPSVTLPVPLPVPLAPLTHNPPTLGDGRVADQRTETGCSVPKPIQPHPNPHPISPQLPRLHPCIRSQYSSPLPPAPPPQSCPRTLSPGRGPAPGGTRGAGQGGGHQRRTPSSKIPAHQAHTAGGHPAPDQHHHRQQGQVKLCRLGRSG